MEFEWDPEKASSNLEKHGVAFEDAMLVFTDPLAVTFPDPDHSVDEAREITIGQLAPTDVLTVVHTLRGESIRIISARRATKGEIELYE